MTNNHDGAKPRRPGDFIIDRYLPDATPEEREEAREAFSAYAHALLRIGERVYRERKKAGEAVPPNSASVVALDEKSLQPTLFDY